MLLLDDQGHQVRLSAGLKVEYAPAWTADSTPLTRVTAWNAMHDLDAGLRATATWYRERGWI